MVWVSFRFTCHFQFFPPNEPFLLFYVSTWLARCGKSLTALTEFIELKTGRKIPHLRFPHVLESMKLQNWKNYLLRIQKKGHKNKNKKTWMKWNDTKWNMWYFQQCACVNAIYFAPVVTTTYRMKNNKSSTRGPSLEMSVLARARAQLLNMLYISTILSVPHGENIKKNVLYI